MEERKEMTVDALKVKVYDTRQQMGDHAAHDVIAKIKELLGQQALVNIIFAAAPSQNEFLDTLAQAEDVEWNRVNAFHMDEYIGLEREHPERFSNFLKERIFDRVPLHQVYYLNNNGLDPDAESQRYTELLKAFPVDIVCMGIGENAHVAFNDPHVADFNDPLWVKTVELEEASRQQQVHDNCFASIAEVPVSAITLTVPALLQAAFIYCIVPGANKAEAVSHTLHGPIQEQYPSTILRKHPHAVLYLDTDSAAKI